ncbi:MAG: N-acetylmuramic acid 6-phosphate etherase [Bacteroidota bacterium]|nr:N-acetylmuramic acid 6-phosphate etherase [Bacteroidota bacterium]
MNFIKITEQDSNHNDLEKKSVRELVESMHEEDNNALNAVKKSLPEITKLIEEIAPKIKSGGRLFYIGAGTSGRLGVLDASECPPTFGTPPEKVVGLIAGGVPALYSSIEIAEDSYTQAWEDLKSNNINTNDFVIGIAASGTTPYVVGGLKDCKENNISTACITCNKNTPLSKHSDHKIEVIVGPEFVTGSSRLKAGTAQKLILNMVSTISMILLGHVRGNKMVDMQLTNSKLNKRAREIVMKELNVDIKKADELIIKHKNVRSAIDNFNDE